MCYRFTKDPAYLEQAEKIAKFFFNLSDMPSGLIPYWDMKAPAIPQSPRDASAATVFASGLYELSAYASDWDYKLLSLSTNEKWCALLGFSGIC